MTVPRAQIWEQILVEALEVIPEGVVTDLSQAFTFYDWREKGGYHVTGSTKKDFHVNCATKEFGGMIACEVSALLDQALEHRLLISAAFQQKKTPSRSWLLVTTYYWCLFLALAWLRIVGKIVTYLPTVEIDRLKKLGSGKTKTPTTGTYMVSVDDTAGARSLLIYRRLKSNNFHDGLWETFYADIDQRLLAMKQNSLNPEFQLFSALSNRNKFDKSAWLSKLRNAVNYRVGFAYGSVNGRAMPEMLEMVKAIKSSSFKDLVIRLEAAQVETAGRSVLERPDAHSRVMLLFGAVMTHMLEEYCQEIWQVRAIDPKWEKRRNKYTAYFNEASNTLWPL